MQMRWRRSGEWQWVKIFSNNKEMICKTAQFTLL
jgi:hypothetical protein